MEYIPLLLIVCIIFSAQGEAAEFLSRKTVTKSPELLKPTSGEKEKANDDTSDVSTDVMPTSLENLTIGAPLAGIKFRLTQKAFDDISEVLLDLIMAYINSGVEIPDYDLNLASLGTVKLSNIVLKEFPRPQLKTTVHDETGLSMNLQGVEPVLTGDYLIKFKVFFYIARKRGTFKLRGKNIGVNAKFHNYDWTEDHPTMSMYNCSVFGDIASDFRGDMSSILKTAFALSFPAIRATMRSRMCGDLEDFLENTLPPVVRQMNEPYFISPQLAFLYGYTAPLQFYDGAVESNHLGQFSQAYNDSHLLPSPYSPPEMTVLHDLNDRHIYVFMSEYTANTLMYAGTMSTLFTQRLTKDMLPEGQSEYLQTTCQENCVGAYLPDLATLYPDSHVTFTIQPAEPPMITFADDFVSVKAGALVQLGVEINGTQDVAYSSVDANINITMKGEFRNHHFYFAVRNVSIDFTYGEYDPLAKLLSEHREMTQSVLLQQVNAMGEKGFALPAVIGLKLNCSMTSDPRLPGVLILATDLDLNHNEFLGLIR